MSEPTVTVRGVASLECPPDLATLVLTLHRSADTAEEVHSALAAAAAELAEQVERFRLAVEQSSSSGLHVAPVFRRPDGARLSGYRGSYATTVVLADFEAMSSLVQTVATVARLEVDGPSWSLRPDHPRQRSVRLAAVADARQRADDYAAAFGATITGVLGVSDLDEGYGGLRRFGRAASAPADEPALDFQPAPQTVTGSVTVRFTMSAPVLDPAP